VPLTSSSIKYTLLGLCERAWKGVVADNSPPMKRQYLVAERRWVCHIISFVDSLTAPRFKHLPSTQELLILESAMAGEHHRAQRTVVIAHTVMDGVVGSSKMRLAGC